MADPSPQGQNLFEHNAPAAPLPQDYYSVLVKVIEAVSQDPAQLRRLVYAMAWHNLRPDLLLSHPLPNEVGQARTVLELERTLEFKRAIERVEAEVAPSARTHSGLEHARERRRAFERLAAEAVQQPQERIGAPTPSAAPSWKPLTDDANPFRDGWNSSTQSLNALDEPANSLAEEAGAEFESFVQETESEAVADDAGAPSPLRSSDNAVIILPEQPPVWLQRTGRTIPDRLPLWQDRPIRVAVEMVGHATTPGPHWIKFGFLSFLQLVAAAVVGVALYIGISDWLHPGRQSASIPAQIAAPAAPAAAAVVTASRDAPVAGVGQSALLLPPRPEPVLPFPLPKTYGVYAGSNGQLTELAPLPIKIPDARILLSAEIRRPSQATLPSGKLAFVVFRRDLLNSAPQTISVRVVARVARAMRFVDGKPVVTPIEGAWRIRNKGYEFKVSPLDGQREMIVIQPDPDFVFPAGRYALVLNGYGYDFTVPGKVTSAEQCLEQAEMLNGTVLSECAKS